MAKFPALLLWTDSYLSDTTHLTVTEHGWYLLVLIHLWRMPQHRFPNDDDWLARKFGVTSDTVRAELRPILKEFCQSDGNWITQARLKREVSKLLTYRQRQSDLANRRWHKGNGDARASNAGAAMPAHAMHPTPTPTQQEKEKPNPSDLAKRKISEASSLPADFPDAEAIAEAQKFWAGKKRYDLNTTEQADQFRDHCTANGKRSRDWRAAWRVWFRNAVTFNPQRRAGNGQDRATFATASQQFIDNLSVFTAQDVGPLQRRGGRRDDPPTIEGTARRVGDEENGPR